MTDKDFCLSSYLAFRYIWKDGKDFCEGFQHKNFLPVESSMRIPVRDAKDIHFEIAKQIDKLYDKYENIGILLSGGRWSVPVRRCLWTLRSPMPEATSRVRASRRRTARRRAAGILTE